MKKNSHLLLSLLLLNFSPYVFTMQPQSPKKLLQQSTIIQQPPSPKLGHKYSLKNPTQQDYYLATEHIKNILARFNSKSSEEKLEIIKHVLNDRNLTNPFSKQVKSLLIKNLAGQIYNSKIIEINPNEIPCQVTTYFDGLQAISNFLGEGTGSIKTYDPDKSPWHAFSLRQVIYTYDFITKQKQEGLDYPYYKEIT